MVVCGKAAAGMVLWWQERYRYNPRLKSSAPDSKCSLWWTATQEAMLNGWKIPGSMIKCIMRKTSLVTEYAWEMSYICWWERWVNFDWLSGLSMEAANGFLPCWWPFVRLVFSGEWHQLCNARKLVAGSTVKLGVREEANNKVLYLCPHHCWCWDQLCQATTLTGVNGPTYRYEQYFWKN
jgi:hypothetical protein